MTPRGLSCPCQLSGAEIVPLRSALAATVAAFCRRASEPMDLIEYLHDDQGPEDSHDEAQSARPRVR